MEKVIFLDIDGVLNDSITFQKMHGDDTPSDEHLKCLKEIVDATGAEIVLSSTWRLFVVSKRIVEKRLADFGLSLSDCTEELECRADEINMWLKNHSEVRNFVILDDEPISFSFPKNLVRTTFEKGLLKEHVKKAIEILNN